MKWTVVVALLCACSGKKSEPPPKTESAPPVAVRGPRVTTATVLAPFDQPPPLVVLLDDNNTRSINAVPRWDADPWVGALAVKDDAALGTQLANVRARKLDPAAALAALGDPAKAAELAMPPPPPPDKPDDGSEESGGTGTLVNLDEDTIERAKEEERKRIEADPKLKREKERRDMYYVSGTPNGSTEIPEPFAPVAMHRVAGEVIVDAPFDAPTYGVVLAAPTAKARELVNLLAATHANLGVIHEGKLRPLRVDFTPHDWSNGGGRWIELRLNASGLALEVPPGVPTTLDGALDPTTLAAALDKTRKEREVDPRARVDVLVDDGVDAQRLVDVLVALDLAGVRMIGLGDPPDAAAAALRGTRRQLLRFGAPFVHGEIARDDISRRIFAERAKLEGCYNPAAPPNPAIAGDYKILFTISKAGKVVKMTSEGADKKLAKCIADVVQTVTFPPPSKPGDTKVNYRFWITKPPA